MNTNPTNPTKPRIVRQRIGRAIAISATVAGGLVIGGHVNAAPSDGACAEAFYGGTPGAEISFFAPTFDRYSNPGAGWHEDGSPFVAGRCNPNWAD